MLIRSWFVDEADEDTEGVAAALGLVLGLGRVVAAPAATCLYRVIARVKIRFASS